MKNILVYLDSPAARLDFESWVARSAPSGPGVWRAWGAGPWERYVFTHEDWDSTGLPVYVMPARTADNFIVTDCGEAAAAYRRHTGDIHIAYTALANAVLAPYPEVPCLNAGLLPTLVVEVPRAQLATAICRVLASRYRLEGMRR